MWSIKNYNDMNTLKHLNWTLITNEKTAFIHCVPITQITGKKNRTIVEHIMWPNRTELTLTKKIMSWIINCLHPGFNNINLSFLPHVDRNLLQLQ